MRYFILVFALLFLPFCATDPPPRHPPREQFSPPSLFKNCKFQKVITKGNIVGVAFFNNCGKDRDSLYGVVIYDTQNIKLAGYEAQNIIKTELGYNPTLGLLTKIIISDKHGVAYPFFIFVDITPNKKNWKEQNN